MKSFGTMLWHTFAHHYGSTFLLWHITETLYKIEKLKNLKLNTLAHHFDLTFMLMHKIHKHEYKIQYNDFL